MTLDFTSILARWQMLADGAWLTVQLASVTTLTGFLIGTLCAVARRSSIQELAEPPFSTSRICARSMPKLRPRESASQIAWMFSAQTSWLHSFTA